MSRPGGPEVLGYVEVPTPEPRADEVLVRAHAIGVNGPELLVRRGAYGWMPALPLIPGIEMSGVVAAKGAAVDSLREGDRVYVSARELAFRGGCYAQYIAVPEAAAVALPPKVDFDSAATLAAYQVAWHLLSGAVAGFEFETLVVPGAAGGIGCALVQMAALRKKRVLALVGSEEKKAFALRQGAAHAVDRHRADLGEEMRGFTAGRGVDVILDISRRPDLGAQFERLAPFGTLVLYGHLDAWPQVDLPALMRKVSEHSPAVRIFSMHALDRRPQLRRSATAALLRLLDEGAIRPVIQERVPLQQASRAHALMEQGGVMGKLVLKP